MQQPFPLDYLCLPLFTALVGCDPPDLEGWRYSTLEVTVADVARLSPLYLSAALVSDSTITYSDSVMFRYLTFHWAHHQYVRGYNTDVLSDTLSDTDSTGVSPGTTYNHASFYAISAQILHCTSVQTC